MRLFAAVLAGLLATCAAAASAQPSGQAYVVRAGRTCDGYPRAQIDC